MGRLGTSSRTVYDAAEDVEQIEAQKVPIIFPPFGLDEKENYEKQQKNVVFRVLDLFKGVAHSSDLTRFQLPPQFNMPKSQLQAYGETIYSCGQDLLSKCAEEKDPIARFLAVVRWHISTVRAVPFGKAPYNPILGETHHVSCGDFNILLEQVSHHPPICACYGSNQSKKIELLFWHQASPKFFGSGVEATIHGKKVLKLASHDETYELTCPKMGIRFFPIPGTDWSGNTTVCCSRSRLIATVSFKGMGFWGFNSRKVSGKVTDSISGETLYELSGNWDSAVMLKDKRSGKASMLYDAKATLSNLHAPVIENLNDISSTESIIVWSSVSEGIMNREWDKARHAKTMIEEKQRKTKQAPKFFLQGEGEMWEWKGPHPPPRAPLVVPLS